MAGGRTVDIGFCKVTARPTSKLRRLFHDWIPYVQSRKPRFELIITPLDDCLGEQRFLYTLQYSNGNLHPAHELKSSQLKPRKQRRYKLCAMPLIVTGDTYLVVADRDELRNSHDRPYYQTVYAFTTTNKTLLLSILIGAIIAIASIVANIVW